MNVSKSGHVTEGVRRCRGLPVLSLSFRHSCPRRGHYLNFRGEKLSIISQQRNELSSILILFTVQMSHIHTVSSTGGFHSPLAFSQRPRARIRTFNQEQIQPEEGLDWVSTNTEISRTRHLKMSSEARS